MKILDIHMYVVIICYYGKLGNHHHKKFLPPHKTPKFMSRDIFHSEEVKCIFLRQFAPPKIFTTKVVEHKNFHEAEMQYKAVVQNWKPLLAKFFILVSFPCCQTSNKN